jgi:hypothetical protein
LAFEFAMVARSFDSRLHHGHNRKVVSLRKVFAFVLLGALALVPCLGVCTGWTASADARMACCAGKTPDEAKMCCASSEGRQNADSPVALAVVALPAPEPVALRIASALAPQLRAAFVIDAHDPLTADSERYVLLSVFLI